MRWKTSAAIILLVGLTLSPGLPPTHGNPVIVPDSAVGSIWTNSTFIEMPYAEVLIQIDYLGHSVYHIDVSGNYTIKTNVTQQCAMAFAYPNSWNGGPDFDEEIPFNITLNGTLITTWPFEFENASWVQRWGTDKLYHMSCDPDFVGFNVSLEADINHTLRVTTSFVQTSSVPEIEIGYVSGTALYRWH